jgi:CHASE2 domain-containing sensor protein
MKTKQSKKVMKNKDIASVFVVTTVILTLASGLITGKTLWSLFDFILMGGILLGVGLLLVLASRKIKDRNHRKIALIALIILFALVWAELGVGLFGTPFAGN